MALRRKNNTEEREVDKSQREGDEAESRRDESDAEDQRLALEHERDDLLLKYQRSLADFRNYQQRCVSNEREARSQGAADVLQSVVRVLDHFEMALRQDPSRASAEQILGGVRMIRDELIRAIATHGASPIEPAPGEEFDPHRHEAVQQMEAEGVEPGHVAAMIHAGYTHGDRVLRPAKVAVAPGAADDHDTDKDNDNNTDADEDASGRIVDEEG